jgi:hypothetical protein
MSTSVFINEFHYDNVGTDSKEAIEIAGIPGTDLTGWKIVSTMAAARPQPPPPPPPMASSPARH